jgi:hypothetical protein
LAAANADRRLDDPAADLNRGYHEFWVERATSVARVNGQNLTSLIIDPPDGRIPTLTLEAQKRVTASSEWRKLHAHIVLYRELMGIRRIISMGRYLHWPSSVRSRLGDSIGRWEQDVLIVDTTNYRGPFNSELPGLMKTCMLSSASFRPTLTPFCIGQPSTIRPHTRAPGHSWCRSSEPRNECSSLRATKETTRSPVSFVARANRPPASRADSPSTWA